MMSACCINACCGSCESCDLICRRYDIDEDFLLRVLDDVFVNLQERRGYKGICCKNDFLRG